MNLPDPPDDEKIEQIREDIKQEHADWDPLDLPESQERLVRDLRDAGAPDDMISRVGAGIYHDYVSPLPMPKHQLVADAQAHDLQIIARKAKQGEYDP